MVPANGPEGGAILSIFNKMLFLLTSRQAGTESDVHLSQDSTFCGKILRCRRNKLYYVIRIMLHHSLLNRSRIPGGSHQEAGAARSRGPHQEVCVPPC